MLQRAGHALAARKFWRALLLAPALIDLLGCATGPQMPSFNGDPLSAMLDGNLPRLILRRDVSYYRCRNGAVMLCDGMGTTYTVCRCPSTTETLSY